MAKRKNRLIFISKILFLSLIVFIFLAGHNCIAEAVNYRHELDEIAREFYSFGSTEEILSELEGREQELQEKKEDYTYFVKKAEIEIFRGEIKEVARIDTAEEHFDRALEYAEQALERNSTSRANRQAAEALSMLFNYRSTFFIIRNAGKAENYLENARELADENSVMSSLIWGNYYLQAPSAFGGDPEKGKEIFQEIKDLGHPILELAAMNSLGKKYTEQEEFDKVENLRARFSELFPESPWLEEFPLR